jgi:uncharacterized membrane protein YadS
MDGQNCGSGAIAGVSPIKKKNQKGKVYVVLKVNHLSTMCNW